MKKIGLLKIKSTKFVDMFGEYEKSTVFVRFIEEYLGDTTVQIHCPIKKITEYSSDGVTVSRTVEQEYPSNHICNIHINDEYINMAGIYVFVNSLDDIDMLWEEPLTEI